MRLMMAATFGLLVAACGADEREKRAEMERLAAASGFRPPAVTSRLDYGGLMERRFRTLDRNEDDDISPDELPRADSRLRELDTDGNGLISSTEFSEGMLRRFDLQDLNRDGTVTSEEEREWRAANPGRRGVPRPSAAEITPAGPPPPVAPAPAPAR